MDGTRMQRINGRVVSTNPNHRRDAVMSDFTRGASVSEIATASACANRRVEAVIREALAQVCAMVKAQQAELEAREAPTQTEGTV